MYTGPGAEQLWSEVDQLRIDIHERLGAMSSAFWQADPSDEEVLDWLKEQAWSEREGSKLHAYPVMKMADVLDAEDIVTLLRQGSEEAGHCVLVEECLANRNESAEGFEPKEDWRAVFEMCFKAADPRDPIHFCTLFYMSPYSEGAALATAEAAIEACRGTKHDDIAQAYLKIMPEERSHRDDGIVMLRKYIKSREDLEQSLQVLKDSLNAGVSMENSIDDRVKGAVH